MSQIKLRGLMKKAKPKKKLATKKPAKKVVIAAKKAKPVKKASHQRDPNLVLVGFSVSKRGQASLRKAAEIEGISVSKYIRNTLGVK